MINKRVFAFIIDLVVAAIPAIFAMVINSESFDIEMFSYILVVLYITHTSILLIATKKHTLGERFLKICCVSITDNSSKVTLLILRNLIFIILLTIVLISYGEGNEFIWYLIMFIAINLVVIVKNKYKKNMTAIDFLFKTHYVECELK